MPKRAGNAKVTIQGIASSSQMQYDNKQTKADNLYMETC